MKESQLNEPKSDRCRPFMPGDIVRLRSGGPRMTISCADSSHGRIECSWFARSSRCSGNFQVEELTRIEDEQYKEVVRQRLDWGLESLDTWHVVPKDRAAGETTFPAISMSTDQKPTTGCGEAASGKGFGG